MDDESDKISRLEDRIEQLEATTKKMMPTRRDALKYGGAAAIGAAAMSGTASAGSAQVGTIGDASNLVDVEAEDIDVADTINGASVSGAAAGEALTSDGSGGLTFAEVGGGVPPNFSYNNVKSSRSLNTKFTNNTGKALFVIVSIRNTPDTQKFAMRVEIDNIELFNNGGSLNSGQFDGLSNAYTTSFFVPDGSDYEVIDIQNNIQIYYWFEAEMWNL